MKRFRAAVIQRHLEAAADRSLKALAVALTAAGLLLISFRTRPHR